jgi:hypothetical protein
MRLTNESGSGPLLFGYDNFAHTAIRTLIQVICNRQQPGLFYGEIEAQCPNMAEEPTENPLKTKGFGRLQFRVRQIKLWRASIQIWQISEEEILVGPEGLEPPTKRL